MLIEMSQTVIINLISKGEQMTIEKMKEAKEELEHDIQNRLMVFERKTGAIVYDIVLEVDVYDLMGKENTSIREITTELKVAL